MGVFITNSYNMGSCLSKALADQSINKVSLRDISKETNSDLDQSRHGSHHNAENYNADSELDSEVASYTNQVRQHQYYP